jgi:endonuclease YncB( thermonuclease family)
MKQNHSMGRFLIALLILASVAGSLRASAQAPDACAGYLFAEDAQRAGVDGCDDLPGVIDAGIIRDHPTGRRGRVSRITDGDTLRVTFGGDEEIIRLFAFNAPELNPIECGAI